MIFETINMFRKHLPILILILILGLYLGVKALDEKSWDGWHFGSAQVLLSDKHWAEDGFFQNYFLFIPQGYSKVVHYFDDPELRQHTHGITTGGFIGKRLYYTHYPAGFLVPTALLMKFGAENRFWFRFLEILFSLGALAILYWIFLKLSNRLVAFLGVFYYGASVLFLDYADTLANQPLDELLRLAIIALSIVAVKNQKKYLNYLIWILYLGLALSSYDSTFFIFAWLIGLDLVIAKKIYPERSRRIEWKKWIFWALAPILAFAIQLFQNTLYLGWHNVLLDLYGTFKVQMVGSRSGFLASHLKRLIEPFGWFFGVKWYLGILISIFGIALVKLIKKYSESTFNIRLLYLSFFALLFNFLFFPSLFFFQARIISVFGGLLLGILTVLTSKALLQKELKPKLKIIFLIILASTMSLWFIQAKRTYAYVKNWPNNTWPAESIEFDKKIKNLVSGDKVVFQMLGLNRDISGSDRYPMAASEDEYYIGSPILGFTNTNDLIRDLTYLKKRSEFPFSAIIITDQKETMGEIKEKLKTHEPISKIDIYFILIIQQ